MSTAFDDMMQGLREVEAYMAGERKGCRVHIPADVIIQTNPEAFSSRYPVHTVTKIDRSRGSVILSGSDGTSYEAALKSWGTMEITQPDVGSKVQLLKKL